MNLDQMLGRWRPASGCGEARRRQDIRDDASHLATQIALLGTLRSRRGVLECDTDTHADRGIAGAIFVTNEIIEERTDRLS